MIQYYYLVLCIMNKHSLQKVMNVHGVILDLYLFLTLHMTVWQKETEFVHKKY